MFYTPFQCQHGTRFRCQSAKLPENEICQKNMPRRTRFQVVGPYFAGSTAILKKKHNVCVTRVCTSKQRQSQRRETKPTHTDSKKRAINLEQFAHTPKSAGTSCPGTLGTRKIRKHGRGEAQDKNGLTAVPAARSRAHMCPEPTPPLAVKRAPRAVLEPTVEMTIAVGALMWRVHCTPRR